MYVGELLLINRTEKEERIVANSNDSPHELDERSTVWKILDVERGNGLSLQNIFLALQRHGLSPNWRIMASLSRRLPFEGIPTEPMVDFLTKLIGVDTGVRIFDPWAGTGVLLSAVAGVTNAGECHGAIMNPDLKPIAEHLLTSASWSVGDPLALIATMTEERHRFDLIVCAPPWNMPPYDRIMSPNSGRRTVKLTLDQQLLLKSCSLLTKKGRVFFVLPNSFLLNSRDGARAVLEDLGFHIWSVISLPSSWNPNTSVPGNVIEIRSYAADEIFVAKASTDSPNTALLANFAERRHGKVPEVGSLVAPEDFTTWDAFETGLVFDAAAKSFGGSIRQLSSITVNKFRVKNSVDGGFVDHANSVFIPKLGSSPAVTSRSDFNIKPQNYIQLVLDPALADADYVANYLNTPLGALTRRMMYHGLIPQASLSTIELASIVLPPVDKQIRIVDLQRRINELQIELKAIQRDLWRTEEGFRVARRELNTFKDGDGLDSWLPRLPYPLSSILWIYRATLDTRRRTEILFAFFEAAAEFLTTIFLSGLRSNPTIYQDLKSGPLKEIESTHWRDATLGFWINVGMNFAKTVRRMLSSDDRLLCLDIFRCSGLWLDAITNKDIFAAIQRVGALRNSWKGHGGIESDRETEQRLQRLQSELTSLFTPLTVAFDDLTLIRPKTFQYDGELYTVVAEDLIGSSVPFREVTLLADAPMKTGGIYLHERGSRDGLLLLPFVRMRAAAPTETACYFYSRLGKEGARFVSYHQAQTSELTEEDLVLSALVEELSASRD